MKADQELMVFLYDHLPRQIKDMLDCCDQEFAYETLGKITDREKYESPIEQIFGTAIEIFLRYEDINYNMFQSIEVDTQKVIQTVKGTFRVDCFITVTKKDGDQISIVVECDGQEYHEKGTNQFERDRSRDRALKLSGYEVLRFTGLEIFKNPPGCVREVFDYLDTIADRGYGKVVIVPGTPGITYQDENLWRIKDQLYSKGLI